MNRKRAVLRMGIIMLLGFTVLIAALFVEAFYFDFAHGLYAIAAVLLAKFALAMYAKTTLARINRDYPAEENLDEATALNYTNCQYRTRYRRGF